MGSITAREVAREVSETIRNEKPVNLGKIIQKKGYSKSTSLKPKLVTGTKSYQEQNAPLVKQMERERQRIIKAMEEKDLTQVQYQHLAEVVDKFSKNINLLKGGEDPETPKVTVINYFAPNGDKLETHPETTRSISGS